MNVKKFFKYILIIFSVFLCGVALITAANFILPKRLEIPFINNQKADKGFINVVVAGLDSDGYRTDIIMVAQLNKGLKEAHILQIPRDTRVETKREDKKINSVYAFGKEAELFNIIKNKFGINADKFVLINLKGFRALIDEIGGVYVNVPIDMKYDDPAQNLTINLNKGNQLLDGSKAEMFVRFRKNNDGSGYPDGDLGRICAQKAFYNAVLDKVISPSSITKLPKFINLFKTYVKTNIKPDDTMELMKEAILLDKSKIFFHTAEGEAKYIDGGSYFVLDDAKNNELVKSNFNKEGSISSNKNTAKATEDIPKFSKNIKVELVNASKYDDAETIIKQQLKEMSITCTKTQRLSDVYYNRTQLIDRTGKKQNESFKAVFKNADLITEIDKSKKVDVTIIIGNDIYK